MKQKLLKALLTVTLFSQIGGITAFAQTNGYGQGQGRTDTVNSNDYSTNSWDSFKYNYEFETGVDYSEELGRPTQTDIVPRNPQTENVRRNKDVSFSPPPYGAFSGEFDTERSNPYITIKNYEYARNTTNTLSSKTYDTLSYDVNGVASDTGVLKPTSISSNYTPNSAISTVESSLPPTNSTSNVTVSTSQRPNETNTQALLYEDGSIGTISIPKIGVKVKVFEGEHLDNLKKGVGHFSFTSAWDGVVGIAGHNGGLAGYFENLKDLNIGDEIIYKTKYGERIYKISLKQKISDTDYSTLGYSTENQLTLITCVENSPNERLSVIAVEK